MTHPYPKTTYPIALEKGDNKHAFGVDVPDLPGCFSAGDTREEAIDNAREAILLWLEAALENNRTIPHPQPIATHQQSPEFAGRDWELVTVDVTSLCAQEERKES